LEGKKLKAGRKLATDPHRLTRTAKLKVERRKVRSCEVEKMGGNGIWNGEFKGIGTQSSTFITF
jgi:CRISPR/Cas system Type II protein with McrA/HNH and RuvC-like nuclease domain